MWWSFSLSVSLFKRLNIRFHTSVHKFIFWRQKNHRNIWVLFTILIKLGWFYFTALNFSADSNEKYVLYVSFCFLPFKIVSSWYTCSEIWKISALACKSLNICHIPVAPNPSLLEHQVIVLQIYVFSLSTANRRKLDLWRTKYSREYNVILKLVHICSLVTACHKVSAASEESHISVVCWFSRQTFLKCSREGWTIWRNDVERERFSTFVSVKLGHGGARGGGWLWQIKGPKKQLITLITEHEIKRRREKKNCVSL